MKLLSYLLSFIAFAHTLWSQDIQYAQYYANPLYLNPALAGIGDNTRLMATYRNQWPKMPGKYISYTAAGDLSIPEYNSGIGVYLAHDRIAAGKLNSSEVALMYNYHVMLANNWNFHPAIQCNLVSRNSNFSDFTFNEQYTNAGFTGSSHTEAVTQGQSRIYADISSGAVLYNETVWIGTSLHHLNRPNQSLLHTTSRLPIKLSIHGGVKIPLRPYDVYAARTGNDREVSLTPTLMYKAQGRFDQLDLGSYLYYQPFLIGVWYRGLPYIKHTNDVTNHAAVVIMAGYKAYGFRFGYSYDISLNKVGAGGAHEISIGYEFKWEYSWGKSSRSRSPRYKQQPPNPFL